MTNITKGIRKLKRPDWVQIQLPNRKGGKTFLFACYNGNTVAFPISKHVAEILISKGIGYGS